MLYNLTRWKRKSPLVYLNCLLKQQISVAMLLAYLIFVPIALMVGTMVRDLCKRRFNCIVLYLLPVLNPKSYDGARVLEASGRPMLVIGRSYGIDSIQAGRTTKLAEETTE